MLKYARFTHPTQHEVFILTLPPLKLSSLADIMRGAGYTPISAGLVNFGPAGLVTTHDESVSLGLKPMPDDAQRIYILYVNTPIGHRDSATDRAVVLVPSELNRNPAYCPQALRDA